MAETNADHLGGLTMNARTALTAAALMGCFAVAAPAAAASHQGDAPPLGTHLTYGDTSWTVDGDTMNVTAPQGWTFVLTPEGQARFNDPDRPDLLSMGYRGDAPLHQQLQDKVAALRGTPGLRILESRVDGHGSSMSADLHYRWTPPGGDPRFVGYRYQDDHVYAVAGPIADRNGLKTVLGIASDTGECD